MELGYLFEYIIDQYVKLGYAGDNIPKYVFPAIVGRPALRAEEADFGDIEVKVLL